MWMESEEYMIEKRREGNRNGQRVQAILRYYWRLQEGYRLVNSKSQTNGSGTS